MIPDEQRFHCVSVAGLDASYQGVIAVRLHQASLRQPCTGKGIEIEAPPPADFEGLLNVMRADAVRR